MRDQVDEDAPESGNAVPGRRARNKAAKEKAIRDAAQRLFVENGYEATTLREIAVLAGVGFGTVFSYAKDKSGLLAMIFVEQLKTMPPLFEANSGGIGLAEELLAGLGHLYEFWATVPTLSRHVLQQMEFYSGNPYMMSILQRRADARAALEDWLIRGIADGRIGADINPQQAADTLFAIYTSAVREWAATTPNDVNKGLDRLRDLMALAVQGLAEHPGQERGKAP